MAQNTMMNNATINAAVAMTKEGKDMMNMTKKELVTMAKEARIKGYSRMTKADLVAAIKFFTNEERKKAEAVVAIEEPVVEVSVGDLSITKDTMAVEVKEETSMKDKYLDSKWDKLVRALASEYVKQSLGVKWALFYKNSKSTVTTSEYLVKTRKLWGATSKVIKTLYGEKNCSEDTIKQSLTAMVARGYLNFKKVQGRDGSINVIFNATTDQMNAMWKLSK